MIRIRKADQRGRTRIDWLDSRHTFSFGDYLDPSQMGFRSLRVINDDWVAPNSGFGMHPHRDMEIVTYVLEGELQHRDSMGHGEVLRAGELQRMTAGTGIRHSEFNPSPTEPVHLLQIWLLPDKKGLKPRYAERTGAALPDGRLNLVASKAGRDGSIAINQDSDLYLAKIKPGEVVTHSLQPQRHAWVHVAEGEVTLNGQKLRAGDGAAVSDERELKLGARSPAQVLLFDLN